MSDHYDRDGEPLSLEQWVPMCGNAEYKRVAWDELPGGGYLSTVWMGLDHAFNGGPPLIFESMAFPTDKHDICERYSTQTEALAGHARILAALKAR